MPQRNALAGATGIGPDPGSRSLPKTSAQVLTSGSIMDVIKALGLSDPLGVGEGSQRSLPADVLASGKPISELLGEVLTMPKTTTSDGLSLPKRVRVSQIDPHAGTVKLHGANMTGTPMSASTSDFDQLFRSGVLRREGPATEGLSLESLVARLAKLLKE